MLLNTSPSSYTIFQDRDILEFDHLPEQFNFRDAQMKDLAFSLRPGLSGSRPVNTILRGVSGTGKTTTVKRIFTEIEGLTERMIPVYVNCRIHKTLFDIVSKIHFHLYGHPPPIAKHGDQMLLERIGNTLVELKVVLVVCLDGANYLLPDNVLNSILTFLLRIHEIYPGAKMGVIATVSNIDTDLSHHLDPSVMSVFRPMEIYFPAYTRDEVSAILQDRISNALQPGAISQEILNCIVDRTMSCGDLRVGLDLVMRGAMYADREGLMEVGSQHVEAAFEVSLHVLLEYQIMMLTTDEKDLLAHIAHLSLEDPHLSLTSDTLFDSAQMKMQINTTLFNQWIRKLNELQLIHLNHTSKGPREKIQEIVLRHDPSKVMEVCG